MKGLKKALVALLTVTAVMAAWIIPVAADPSYGEGVEGGTTSLKKYFVVDEDIEVPTVAFTYDIAAGTAIPANPGSTLEVYAGIGSPTVTGVSFNSSSTTYTDPTTEGDSLALPSGMVYAKDNIAIDFTGIKYTEPGVYRYILTENQCTNTAVICDTAPKTIDVYVVDSGATDASGNEVLTVSNYVIHEDTDAPGVNTTGGSNGSVTKINSITNTYSTTDLYVGKIVTGNQGSRDKFFQFTVKLTGLPANTKLAVDLSKASTSCGSNLATDDSYEGTANPATLTTDDSGAVTGTFYLQSGQYVIIQGIGVTNTAHYEVSEKAEDYISKNSIDDPLDGFTFNAPVDADFTVNPVYVGFTNNREGVIPTGIIMKVAPIAAVGIVVTAGIVILIVRSTKRKAEEEA